MSNNNNIALPVGFVRGILVPRSSYFARVLFLVHFVRLLFILQVYNQDKMTYVTLLILGLILQASMGLSPPSPSDQTRKLYSRAAHTVGGVLVAATLLTAPLPAEAEATLTKQDVIEIVKASEERTALKFKEVDLKFKEVDLKMDQLSNKMDKLENLYILVPVVTTVGAAFVAGISNYLASKSLGDAVASFVGEKETIKKELAANTQSKAFEGTILGVCLTLGLVVFGAGTAYAVIHPPQ